MLLLPMLSHHLALSTPNSRGRMLWIPYQRAWLWGLVNMGPSRQQIQASFSCRCNDNNREAFVELSLQPLVGGACGGGTAVWSLFCTLRSRQLLYVTKMSENVARRKVETRLARWLLHAFPALPHRFIHNSVSLNTLSTPSSISLVIGVFGAATFRYSL